MRLLTIAQNYPKFQIESELLFESPYSSELLSTWSTRERFAKEQMCNIIRSKKKKKLVGRIKSKFRPYLLLNVLCGHLKKHIFMRIEARNRHYF